MQMTKTCASCITSEHTLMGDPYAQTQKALYDAYRVCIARKELLPLMQFLDNLDKYLPVFQTASILANNNCVERGTT